MPRSNVVGVVARHDTVAIQATSERTGLIRRPTMSTTHTFPPINEQLDLIRRGTEQIIPEEELERKLEASMKEKRPLRVKLGADPSRPDLHIGHAVQLQKMRDFQDLGHHAILIVGDFTASIGDPTGRSKTRPALTIEETRENGRSYFEQATRILSEENLEILHNGDWLSPMTFAEVIKLAANATVAQMLERDDFSKRYGAGEPISLHELLYPLVQGYDSVAIRSDVELGGTDQTFNLLVARDLQRAAGQEQQVVVTCALLRGTDGVEKMSKSHDNYIALTDEPSDIYGKTLSIPDDLMPEWYRLALFRAEEEVATIAADLESGTLHPRDAKRTLARDLVARYHDEAAGREAEAAFDKVFIKKGIPDDIPSITLTEPIGLLDLMNDNDLASSKGEARRLVQGGGVSIDGEKIDDPMITIEPQEGERVVKVGKRRFLRIQE